MEYRAIRCALLFLLQASTGVRTDNLGTLRTYQKAGCDDDVVTLRCPPGTSISVQVAQYGRSAASATLCPRGAGGGGGGGAAAPDSACLWPDALQYSLLQTVVEACQKKRQCKFHTSPKAFGGDPCPGARKYVEVAYKCRPSEFRSKVACENEAVMLECAPNSRIAVYSASFGRTEYESLQCPQAPGAPEETCLVSYATEAVMHSCHGKRRCRVTADSATFGRPCRRETRVYLKVVYTCVPRKVLKETFDAGPEDDETASEAGLDGGGGGALEDYEEFFREPAAAPPPSREDEEAAAAAGGNGLDDRPAAPTPTRRPPPHGKADAEVGKRRPEPNPVSPPHHRPADHATTKDMQGDHVSDETNTNCTITIYTNEKTRVIGFISEWINAYNFISRNQEKFYLYLILSVTAGLLLFLGLVIGRLLVQRQRARREAKFHATSAAGRAPPHGFADDISEIDADIDLTGPVAAVAAHSPPVGVAEVVRFGGTLRRGQQQPDFDSSVPRSLNRSGNSQYYYG
ncbi:uncharacterized protein LOC134537587 isoform X2 [Bacillus rossius redtenbacheri]|uniref:uncharacterized protein LOC134537587 isoform X2 n=1 Tax=Bacillus rossius redtenbacheri TaxID=93214 RepID=UPI002FDCE159